MKEIAFRLTDSRDPSCLAFVFIAVIVHGHSGWHPLQHASLIPDSRALNKEFKKVSRSCFNMMQYYLIFIKSKFSQQAPGYSILNNWFSFVSMSYSVCFSAQADSETVWKVDWMADTIFHESDQSEQFWKVVICLLFRDKSSKMNQLTSEHV